MTEQRKLLSTREAAEYCGFKLSYFPQADDAPGYPDAIRPMVNQLFQERRLGRFLHGCPYLFTGRNRGGSQPLHRRTEVNDLFIHIKKQT